MFNLDFEFLLLLKGKTTKSKQEEVFFQTKTEKLMGIGSR